MKKCIFVSTLVLLYYFGTGQNGRYSYLHAKLEHQLGKRLRFISRIRIRIRIRFFQRSDPDPHQNDPDPQHWINCLIFKTLQGKTIISFFILNRTFTKGF
jgi:hypothetical protein